MKTNLDDLTVEFNIDTADTLVESWTWLTGTNKKALLVSVIGDIFLTDSSKKVYWLDVGVGKLKVAADSIQDFEEKLEDVEQVNEWFMIALATELRLSANKLKGGQLYSYKKLPIMGGDYTVDNFAPLNIEAHFHYTGDIHRQIKDLPNGTKVEIKVAGSGHLEEEENSAIALKEAISDGLTSPTVENFDFDKHLTKLKAGKSKNS